MKLLQSSPDLMKRQPFAERKRSEADEDCPAATEGEGEEIRE